MFHDSPTPWWLLFLLHLLPSFSHQTSSLGNLNPTSVSSTQPLAVGGIVSGHPVSDIITYQSEISWGQGHLGLLQTLGQGTHT